MAVDLLDITYYSQANPDLAAGGLVTEEQLRNHFFQAGLNEGRRFNALVDLNFYRASNSDLTTQFFPTNGDLYNHLSQAGVREGRRFSAFYDSNFYRSTSPDIANFDNEFLFNHARDAGINEGRRFSGLIDLTFYLSANLDLANAFGSDRKQALYHLNLFGISEGRRFSPVLDLSFYNAANPDLRVVNFSNQGLFDHFTYNGINENRRSAISYDTGFYRSTQSDLAAFSGFDLLNHFQAFGINEGRSGSDAFNALTYLANNPDLSAGGLTTGNLGQLHFELAGFREGRASGATALSVSQDPGDAPFSAANLGLIANNRGGQVSQELTNTDREDYYRIVLGGTSTLNFNLSGFNRALGIQIVFDRNGNGLNNGGTQEEVDTIISSSNTTPLIFSRVLGAGTYFLRVTPVNTSGTFTTNYNLALSAAFTPETPVNIDPGSTLATSLFVGTLGNITVQNYVGTPDQSDIYRFNQPSAGNVTFDVRDLLGSGRVRLQIITDANNNGQIEANDIVFTSGAFGNNSTFTRNLPAGIHYLKIEQSDIIQNAAFTLNLRR